MATNKEVVLTYEGLQKLEQELENLKTVKRREVAERIKQALSFGDISDSEYDEAKNEQAYIEGRIFQDIQTDVVSIGSKVKVLDMEFDEEVETKFPMSQRLLSVVR